MREDTPSPELVRAAADHYFTRRRLILGTLRAGAVTGAVGGVMAGVVFSWVTAVIVLVVIVVGWCLLAVAAERKAARRGTNLSPEIDPASPKARKLVRRYLADTRRTPP